MGLALETFRVVPRFSVEFHAEPAALGVPAQEPAVERAGHHHPLGGKEHAQRGLGRDFYSPQTGGSKIQEQGKY